MVLSLYYDHVLLRIKVYRNTVAGSSPGERIFIYFEKVRPLKKLNVSFLFLAKIIKNDLKWLISNTIFQKLIHSIFVLCLHNFFLRLVLFLEMFLDEPAMVLR